jgi:hypothetical protein
VLAYACAAGTLTFQAVAVSLLFDHALGTVRPASPMRVASRASVTVRFGMLVTATAIAVAAVAAFVYKMHQHIF